MKARQVAERRHVVRVALQIRQVRLRSFLVLVGLRQHLRQVERSGFFPFRPLLLFFRRQPLTLRTAHDLDRLPIRCRGLVSLVRARIQVAEVERCRRLAVIDRAGSFQVLDCGRNVIGLQCGNAGVESRDVRTHPLDLSLLLVFRPHRFSLREGRIRADRVAGRGIHLTQYEPRLGIARVRLHALRGHLECLREQLRLFILSRVLLRAVQIQLRAARLHRASRPLRLSCHRQHEQSRNE